MSLRSRLLQFRAKTEEPEKRSIAGKIGVGVGAAAALGGFYIHHRNSASAQKHRDYIEGLKTTPTQPAAAKTPVVAKTPVKARVQIKQTGSISPINQPASTTPPSPATMAASRNVARLAKIRQAAKTVKTQNLSARLRATNFAQSRDQYGRVLDSTSPLSAYRKASRIVPWVNRASQTAGDIGDIASGKQVKEPFYKKAWFKRAAVTSAIALPILANKLANVGEVRIHEKRPPLQRQPKTPFQDEVGRTAVATDKLARGAANAKAAIKRKVGLAARLQATHFAYADALDAGWDVRDARGKSARVYAPGSRRRERREKQWGEKTDNIRKVRNAALVVAAGGIGAAGYLAATRPSPKAVKAQIAQAKASVKPKVVLKPKPFDQKAIDQDLLDHLVKSGSRKINSQ